MPLVRRAHGAIKACLPDKLPRDRDTDPAGRIAEPLAASPGAGGGGGVKRSSFQNRMVPLYHDPGMGPALGGKRTTNDSLSTQPSRNVAPEPEPQKQTLSRDTTNLLVPVDSRPTDGSSFPYCHHKPTWTREDMNPQGNAADDSRCRCSSSAIRLLEDEDRQQEQGMEPLRDSTVDVAIAHTQRHRSSLMTTRAGHLALMMNRPNDESNCYNEPDGSPRQRGSRPSRDAAQGVYQGTQREPQWQTKNGVEEGGTPGCVATIVRLLGPNFLNMPGFWLG